MLQDEGKLCISVKTQVTPNHRENYIADDKGGEKGRKQNIPSMQYYL